MAYYLKWPSNSGNASTNNALLEISGIAGVLQSLVYTIKVNAADITLGTNAYVFDNRRSLGSTVNGGGGGYILGFSVQDGPSITGYTKNGAAAGINDLFSGFVVDDVLGFTTNEAPSGGTIAFACRFNEVEHFYDYAVGDIVITDDNGAHTIDMSSSQGTATSFTSLDGALTATLYNFPADNSHWVADGEPTVGGTPPNAAPANVSGTITGTTASLSWDSLADADSYTYEFRRKA